MEYTPISPFMRPISLAHMRVVQQPEAAAPGKPVSKWELLRELSKAQATFGISERDLTVLQGLLSFFPDDALGRNADMVIFPSNKAICERLNGMPCSTMRRHIARLVDAGLLMRRDSPNGKRYVRKHGEERVAFGFDLSPLYRRSEEVARAAEAVREAEERVRRLREVVSLMRRDLASLAEFGEELQPSLGLWDQLRDKAVLTARALRRKLTLEELSAYREDLEARLDQARDIIDGPETEEMITNDAHYERRLHNSNKETIDLEPALEKGGPAAGAPHIERDTSVAGGEEAETKRLPKIPLHLVIAGCPSLKTFYQGEVRHWHQLYSAASHVRPAMGISASAWEEAQRFMGPEQASIVVVAMLERFAEIRSPGGYLRALTTKAAAGEFSCGPMIMALISRRDAA
ncbi:replication initiation protein [Rhodobacter sphaeroides]|uniref:Replication initiator RepC n=1 Tax=Cereibacter sphaeroides (strain ATCC 17023 / DSM 158 / JCM 6121 / CCUG 31486 / LMG 2827 / NBRC 12203 / NCIMB 8253 / ATH 2.4.1.) TaxID=272943 RepID=Q3IUZ8_CERS4|nr:plasmid replication protein RepC [Cereibacter sphaeroides]ABA81636.1 replication initiator RepC [Cereibacter sphaeroides 2.4.1]AXC64162.1 replication initiation protein [Cereibacter sphaeroides 2.4.1]MVX50225.1 replication initiation protein [Cereibacter sphaeroides]MVX50320.1 replication initiation protein [Cereibacter sphaeroides]QJC86880.1 replication initiation protein RepC [Cereibacter sphaeroides]